MLNIYARRTRSYTETRHLSFPRFYSRRLILNRGSQGRLRNPARHCEDANQFSFRGSFSRSFHRVGTKLEGRKEERTSPRVQRAYTHRAHVHSNMRSLSIIRMAIPPSFPFPLHLLSIFFPISNLYLPLIGNARDRKEQLCFKNKFNAREIASLSRNKLRKNIPIFKRVLVESNLFATQRLTPICQYHCRQKSGDNLKFRSHCFAIIRLLRFLSRLQHP